MNIILCAGYPKSGNTLLGRSLQIAGGIRDSPFDWYWIKKKCIIPTPNPIFKPETCCIKIHDKYRAFRNIYVSYPGKIVKVIVIMRNPLDTLLSSINFFRVVYRNFGGRLPLSYRSSLRILMPNFTMREDFLKDFTLEKLRDDGMLDAALDNFGKNDTVIPHLYYRSGAWSNFASSYNQMKIDSLKVSYEDLESISINSIDNSESICQNLLKVAHFLDVDYATLKSGFAQQRRKVLKIKSLQVDSSVSFYNKMSSGYWRDYFTPEACRKFARIQYSAIVRNGYGSILDQID